MIKNGPWFITLFIICDFNLYDVEVGSDFTIDFRPLDHFTRPTIYLSVENTYFDNATGNIVSYGNNVSFSLRSFPYSTQIMLNGEVTADFYLAKNGLSYTLTLRHITEDIKILLVMQYQTHLQLIQVH